MLITILASIGLYVVVILVYRKGKKDGIDNAIDLLIKEMKRKNIDIESIIVDEEYGILEKSKKIKLLPFLRGRKKDE